MSFDANAWSNTSIDGGGNEPPAPGTYEVALDDADYFTSKAGRDIIKLTLRVTHGIGDTPGHTWDEIRGLATEGQMKAAKATCARLGIDVDAVQSADDLKAELQACIGRYYTVEVKQNGQYRNTYINDRITGGPVSDIPSDLPAQEPAGELDAAGQPIPF
jgi:hypothetical protein